MRKQGHVSALRKKRLKSHSQSRSVTPSLDTHSIGCRVGGVTSTHILDALYVIYSSLVAYCVSLCNRNSRNPYSLSKGLLVKYWCCLTSTPWTTPTSSPSTSHLHMSNGKLSSYAVSLRCKHNLETLFTY